MNLICTLATVNRALKAELADIGWGGSPQLISTINRATLITVPPSIEHHFIDCVCEEDESAKITALVDHFRNKGLSSALVFISGSAPIVCVQSS